MWRSRALALLAAIVLVFAACGDDSGADTTTTTATDTTSTVELDPRADADHGYSTLTAGFEPDPMTVDVTAGGQVPAATIGCEGYVTPEPDFEIQWTGDAGLEIAFAAGSDADTTLVVNGPTGRWHCDDDSNGSDDPTVRFPSPAEGTIDIWVGSSQEGALANGELLITEVGGGDGTTTSTDATTTTAAPSTTGTTAAPGTTAAGSGTTGTTGTTLSTVPGITVPSSIPTSSTLGTIPTTLTIPTVSVFDPSLDATYEITLDAGFQPDPFDIPLTSGGEVPAGSVGCAGFGPTNPHVRITNPDNDPNGSPFMGAIGFYFIADDPNADTTLIVEDGSGNYYCDDDYEPGTWNPMVQLTGDDAQYNIWVGSFWEGETHSGSLYMTSDPANNHP